MVYALQTLVQSSRITPAPLWRVALACLLDALLLAAGIGVTIMLFRRDFLTAVIIAAWLTLALIVWQAVALVRTGQPFAWRLFRLRLTSLGGYPGVGLIKVPGTVYAVADLMLGADPLAPISAVTGDGALARLADRRSQEETSRVKRALGEHTTPDDPTGHSGAITDTRSGAPAPDQLRRARVTDPKRGTTARRGADTDPLDTHTRVQPRESTWVPPRDADPTFEPVIEETIFAAQATPQWRVLLDGDDIGPLTEPIIFGRNPSPEEGTRAVTVMDLSREVSKQHLRLTITADGVAEVEDLNSTNGSQLQRRTGEPQPLAPGETHRFTEDMAVQFSGHTLTIVRKGGDLS